MHEQLAQSEDAISIGPDLHAYERSKLQYGNKPRPWQNLHLAVQQEPTILTKAAIFKNKPEEKHCSLILQRLPSNYQWPASEENIWTACVQVESIPQSSQS